jgi:ABC-type amino acid transport substrate-binding protein
MKTRSITRRDFLRFSVAVAGGMVAAACGQANSTQEAGSTPTTTSILPTTSPNTLIAGGTYWAPWQIYDGEKTSGISIDVMQAVSKIIKADMVFEQLSQNRMLSYFVDNKIDLELASNPVWRGDYKNVSLYSIPYIQTQDVAIVRGDSDFSPQSVQDFKGKRVGCTLGYFYPEFQAKFESNEIIREDAPNESVSVQKLQAGRVDVIIIEKMTALYWMKELRINQSDLKTVYDVGTYEIYFRLHRNKKSWLSPINDALKKLIDDGAIQRIAEQYTKNL